MAIPLKNQSGLAITNGFKMVLGDHPQDGSESRKPEKLWIDRGSEFYKKTFRCLLKEYETEFYSTYIDLKAVFKERFNRTSLHIINKPMFFNGDVNWVNILIDAVITYYDNIHSTIIMTPVDASNNPDKFKYYVNSTKATPFASIVASLTLIDLFLLHLIQLPFNILVPLADTTPLTLLVPLECLPPT